MKFSEMPYTRPDAEALKKQMSQLTERLKSAASYEEARQVFLEKEAASRTTSWCICVIPWARRWATRATPRWATTA